MKPQGAPFFARISSLELACPDCNTVHICRTFHRRAFDKYTSTFKCRECGSTFILGVLAYRTTRYLGARRGPAPPPADRLPTMAQAAQLRAQIDADRVEGAERVPDRVQTDRVADGAGQADRVGAGDRVGADRVDPPSPPDPLKKARLKTLVKAVKPTRQYFRKAIQGRALDHGGGVLVSGVPPKKRGEPVNVLVAGVCRCQVDEDSMAATIDPGCPVHSVRST